MNEFDYIVLGIGLVILLMYLIYYFLEAKKLKDLRDDYEKNLDHFADEIRRVKNEQNNNSNG